MSGAPDLRTRVQRDPLHSLVMQRDEEVLIRVQHEANRGKLQKNAKREILQGRPTSSVTLLASE